MSFAPTLHGIVGLQVIYVSVLHHFIASENLKDFHGQAGVNAKRRRRQKHHPHRMRGMQSFLFVFAGGTALGCGNITQKTHQCQHGWDAQLDEKPIQKRQGKTAQGPSKQPHHVQIHKRKRVHQVDHGTWPGYVVRHVECRKDLDETQKNFTFACCQQPKHRKLVN
jgi:hypothetical protein